MNKERRRRFLILGSITFGVVGNRKGKINRTIVLFLTHPTPMNRGFPSLLEERGMSASGRGVSWKNIRQ